MFSDEFEADLDQIDRSKLRSVTEKVVQVLSFN